MSPNPEQKKLEPILFMLDFAGPLKSTYPTGSRTTTRNDLNLFMNNSKFEPHLNHDAFLFFLGYNIGPVFILIKCGACPLIKFWEVGFVLKGLLPKLRS